MTDLARKRARCEFCSTEILKKNLNGHIKICSDNPDRSSTTKHTIQCRICSKTFRDEYNFKSHMQSKKHKKEEIDWREENPLVNPKLSINLIRPRKDTGARKRVNKTNPPPEETNDPIVLAPAKIAESLFPGMLLSSPNSSDSDFEPTHQSQSKPDDLDNKKTLEVDILQTAICK